MTAGRQPYGKIVQKLPSRQDVAHTHPNRGPGKSGSQSFYYHIDEKYITAIRDSQVAAKWVKRPNPVGEIPLGLARLSVCNPSGGEGRRRYVKLRTELGRPSSLR
jgi:hypothetical protein